jgi:hypothetical protein
MNVKQLKSNRSKAYKALHAYANALVLMGYKPEERVKMIREVAQEIVAQFAQKF